MRAVTQEGQHSGDWTCRSVPVVALREGRDEGSGEPMPRAAANVPHHAAKKTRNANLVSDRTVIRHR